MVFAKTQVQSFRTKWVCRDFAPLDVYDLHEIIGRADFSVIDALQVQQ